MIGSIVQRDGTPNSAEFFFVHDKDVGKGGYVQYEKDGKVIARIAEVFKANQYFEDVEGVSETLGEDIEKKFPVDEWEVSLAKANIMGKFSESGRIERVTQSPEPGTEIGKADPDRVREFLGLKQDGLTIGKVQQQEVDASLDMTDTLQKHFAILAQSGAGKSYTASVLLEELLDSEHSPTILAVDPHGDYTCFGEDKQYMNRVKVFRDDNISIAVNSLSADKIAMFFSENFSSVQRQELAEVFSNLKRGENSDFGIKHLIERVESKQMDEKTKYSLLRKLNRLNSMGIFGKVNSPNKNDLEPGKLNILDLSSMINHRKKQIATAFFGQHFFRLRRQERIPPFLYLLEEAHNFAPEKAPVPSRSVIEKMAREGRKFNAAIGLISQRPVKLSTTALSQCNTKFIMRVTNPNDLDHISQSSEGITKEVTAQIPGLKTGEAITIGEAVNYPTFVDVRKRRSETGDSGEGLEDTLKQWEEDQEQKEKDAEAFM